MNKLEFQTACKLIKGYEIEEGNTYYVSLMTRYTIIHLFKKYIVLRNGLSKPYNVVYDEFLFEIVPKICLASKEKQLDFDSTFIDRFNKRYRKSRLRLLESITNKNK